MISLFSGGDSSFNSVILAIRYDISNPISSTCSLSIASITATFSLDRLLTIDEVCLSTTVATMSSMPRVIAHAIATLYLSAPSIWTPFPGLPPTLLLIFHFMLEV